MPYTNPQLTRRLKRIDYYREWWLGGSIVIYSIVLGLILVWNFADIEHTVWIMRFIIYGIVALGCIWWYWTKRIINLYAEHRKSEFEILAEIIVDIRETQKLSKELFNEHHH